MKRYLGALLCLAMVLILGALPGAAESFTSGDYEYKLDDSGNAEITRYIGEANEMITVPASLDGHPVTAIGDGVFKGEASRGGNEWPVTVRLPVGLTRIGDEAFSNCHGLENITLQETLEHIGERAFAECNGLTKLSLPDGLTSLGTRAFYLCENLADVTLSAGLTSIGEEVFSGCSSLY